LQAGRLLPAAIALCRWDLAKARVWKAQPEFVAPPLVEHPEAIALRPKGAVARRVARPAAAAQEELRSAVPTTLAEQAGAEAAEVWAEAGVPRPEVAEVWAATVPPLEVAAVQAGAVVRPPEAAEVQAWAVVRPPEVAEVQAWAAEPLPEVAEVQVVAERLPAGAAARLAAVEEERRQAARVAPAVQRRAAPDGPVAWAFRRDQVLLSGPRSVARSARAMPRLSTASP
jgi:hypothetical protein